MKRRPSGARGGRVAIALLSAVVLAVTGTVWWSTNLVIGGFNVSRALAEAKVAKSTGGAKNILLMGLDTRRDQNGDPLPADVLEQLHAGTSDNGGYNTNTLILLHVPADGKKVTAFSIPRDDYVTFMGVESKKKGKIKEAYGTRKAEVEDKLAASGVSDRKELESKARESARAATIATVGRLVGVPIDHFAEVSLVGFYDLAQTLGGVEVCLNNPVRDSYSGAAFPAGRQKLNASQSLAFVRQRHGLADGDLDRTHRQQAFIAGVMVQLQKQGVFGDVRKLQSLIAVAQKDVVVSDGWNLQEFAQQAGQIAGTNLTFTTLPVLGYDMIDQQAVNLVDPKAIRAQVQKAFGQSVPEPDDADESSGATATAGATPALKPVGFTAPRAPATTTVPVSAAAGPVPDSGTTLRGGEIPCVD
ncbi:LCP family protein [Tsukamurella ocularis]|uniref:LCP family protein n=1 Tax=Tsukamurella ocularis TaxID=1970234 RepID=UPI00216A2F39|nr:LCP family protein [Tsukamurella ocularis]MCS3780549.1 LCP family protein required for cell wall assembly [Tsukamurella ocularis]MCS3785896.1 LCP family protein required for cell wall assembly [Tsukamurella ocularis]MCS3849260.1 LCP family protein required for cell wall assembly [Tsukamurella ocularis]